MPKTWKCKKPENVFLKVELPAVCFMPHTFLQETGLHEKNKEADCYVLIAQKIV